jgi:hypothetical protein
MKLDDHSLDEQQLARIRDRARRALQDASALGRFPTPVDDVVAAADHSVELNVEIDPTFLSKLRKKAGDALKRAVSKVFGALDVAARTMHLGRLVPPHKLPFLKLHELGHGLLEWQRDIYRVTEDCEKTLDPEVSEMFERESNAFASEVLFQLDSFASEAADLDFGLRTPLRLSKKYGASVYSTVRRYVSTNARACSVIVLDPPELVAGSGFKATVRRIVSSPSFAKRFGDLLLPEALTPDDDMGRLIPIDGRKMSRPRTMAFRDRAGARHECVAEAFAYKYYVFVLIYPRSVLTKKYFVLAS